MKLDEIYELDIKEVELNARVSIEVTEFGISIDCKSSQ